MQRESVGQSLLVATCLCIVCSVLVSSASVLLRPRQEANKKRQMERDVLKVAGLYQEGVDTSQLFQKVEMQVVELETGDLKDPKELEPSEYDSSIASKDPELSVLIPSPKDLAGIKRREKYSPVYFVRDSSGAVEQVILPVRGKGLWSTMYGFLSLESDLKTVRGIIFYEHGETPGLGGEIESEQFTRMWQGKVVRASDGTPYIEAIRGHVTAETPDAEHKIDSLAGATITTRGVTDMVRYWLGDHGFGPFLDKQKAHDLADSKS